MRRFYLTATSTFTVLIACLTVLAQTQSGTENKNAEANKAELQKKSLLPSKQERSKYRNFLTSKNTGLIRLLPRERYDIQGSREIKHARVAHASLPRPTLEADTTQPAVLTDAVGDVLGARLELPPRTASCAVGKRSGEVQGGGAFYSFTQRTHQYGCATDLLLERGQFSVGFYGANYGFITDLGDVPLESVDVNTPSVKPLATYKPPSYEPDARLESFRFRQGVDLDGVIVKRRLASRPNSTYLLRAVNYGEDDVLVAFKVVAIDSDGTLLILWKLLKRYPTPQLIRN